MDQASFIESTGKTSGSICVLLVPDVFLVCTEDGDRHSRSDGSAHRPGGEWGPDPCLPEGSEAEAYSQAEEVKSDGRTLNGGEATHCPYKRQQPKAEQRIRSHQGKLKFDTSADWWTYSH